MSQVARYALVFGVCLFLDGLFRKVPHLRGVGINSPVFNIAMMGYGRGMFVGCRNVNFSLCGISP
jgi:hypothetical protein